MQIEAFPYLDRGLSLFRQRPFLIQKEAFLFCLRATLACPENGGYLFTQITYAPHRLGFVSHLRNQNYYLDRRLLFLQMPFLIQIEAFPIQTAAFPYLDRGRSLFRQRPFLIQIEAFLYLEAFPYFDRGETSLTQIEAFYLDRGAPEDCI